MQSQAPLKGTYKIELYYLGGAMVIRGCEKQCVVRHMGLPSNWKRLVGNHSGKPLWYTSPSLAELVYGKGSNLDVLCNYSK